MLSSQSANHNHVVPFYIISDISTHTPLTGNNSTLTPVSKLRSTFQSTLSSLRAIQNGQQHQPSDYFNPRSPHRERQNQTIQREIVVKFQSSLPSQGATQNIGDRGCFFQFQSTLPSQGATVQSLFAAANWDISIHAPLTGSDKLFCYPYNFLYDFNPRSPHRERPRCHRYILHRHHFNPRSPHRERLCHNVIPLIDNNFNPRSPHRERRYNSS